MTTRDLFKVVPFLLAVGVVSSQVLTGGRGPSMPTFIVTSPIRARYDTVTSFSVSATNLMQPATIHLRLRTGTASEITLNETTLTIRPDQVQTWSVVIDSERMLRHQQSNVQLRAEYRSVVKLMDIPMNPLSGFLMIQTDKVIYTPRQTVMYRIIALDDDQHFAQWPVTVDIKNPDLIILERQHHTSREAFEGRNFTLPRDATPGTWSVTAYYEDTKVRTTRTVKFDVQEYVLPTFKVEVSAEKKVIAMSTNWLTIKTKALYSYGQPVQGRAELRLGVVGARSVILFNVTYNATLNGTGQWNLLLPVADLRGHSAWFPDGSRLYISVNITEAGTGEVGTAVAMDTFFANPYYQISFSKSKKYFRPGFPYDLVVDVAAANGDPACNTLLYVIVEMKSEDGQLLTEGYSSTFELDEEGRMVETVMIPHSASALRIHVYTLDPANPDWSDKEFFARKFFSATNNYLHLQYEEENSNLIISYTPRSAFDINIQPITVLVLSRGRLVHSFVVPCDSYGEMSYPLGQDVLLAAAPTARVLAYYYVNGLNTELVSDSLFIDTPDACREELSLDHMSRGPLSVAPPLMPKQRTELDITGGAGMRVGLLAVDKAVYFLRDERSLTRNKMFSMLGEADEGRGIGDGKDTDKIFEFAGLQYMKLSEIYEVTQPVVDSVLEISGLNVFFPDVRRGKNLVYTESDPNEEQIPLEEVRRYFPESWLFREVTLPRNGFRSEEITLPDSITTWVFTGVGVGADGGVCMTRPLELVAFKPFFAQVRLPYKAVRLEEVTLEIGIYNYQHFDINVTVTVRGDLGLCFSDAAATGQQRFVYGAQLRARRTNSETVKVIPLVADSIKLTVDVRSNNGRERDVVEKTLYVVAEGRRVQKSITFPLDPSGKYTSHHPQVISELQMVQRTDTATISNLISRYHKKQLTDIRLYMPQEVIPGSERCQISACGDLMGDIISVSVMNGDNLFESSVLDAEEAIGNLAPSVQALLYLNTSQFMTPLVQAKGRAHVIHGISRLLTYRKQDGSFSLTSDSPSATWLTALVLKTLCHAEQITFIDHESLIRTGFAWLLDQGRQDGKLEERDRRLARPSHEYDLMLSAETLIALHECDRSRNLTDDDLDLMGRQELLLGDHLEEIVSPLVMAKTAYALTLSDPHDELTQRAVQRLSDMKRSNIEGLHYWSVSSSENDPPNRPFWYHSGSKASSIEATAYALLVFSRQAQAYQDYAEYADYVVEVELPSWSVNLDSIAGWLIQKRSSRGAFIGAMDTAAATQALSEYSVGKLGIQEVNLHCNVSTNPTRNYSHAFDFNTENAITPKSLSNVPVGRQLRVETRGTGLGQMQVRVEYNVPVEANADCRYNVTITRRAVSYNNLNRNGDNVCRYCQMGCDDNDDDDNNSDVNRDRAAPARARQSRRRHQRRQRRQIFSSSVSICIEVCIRSSEDMYADRTILEIQMLSGFQPIAEDLTQIYAKREQLSLSSLIYVPERTSVEMKFNQVPHNCSTCVSFRAIERRDVKRRNPAIVTVRAHEDPEPTCVHTYDPVVSEVNLAVYCANSEHNNQGQCQCFSGQCGQCHGRTADVSLNDIQNLVCQSQYIYKIQQTSHNITDDWVDMRANVIATPKSGPEEVESQIQLVTPRSCTCPYRAGFRAPHYFFGSHVNIFVDRNNREKKTYLIDQSTTFVSATTVRHRDPDRTGDFINIALGYNCRN